MEELLKPYVEKALQAMEKGGEFVISQAPELLQEFYTWHFLENVMGACLSFVGVVVLLFIAIKNFNDSDGISAAICIPISILPLISLVITTFEAVKITVAPKLYLIEHFLK